MSKPLFINDYVRDEETIKEFYKDTFSREKKGKLLLVAVIVAYIVIGLFVLKANPIFVLALAAILIAFFVMTARGNYKRSVKTSVERDRERAHGEDFVIRQTFYEDRVEIDSMGNEQEIYYEDIKHAAVSKNYIHIVTYAKFAISVKKDAFTLGAGEDFEGFLASKGVKFLK